MCACTFAKYKYVRYFLLQFVQALVHLRVSKLILCFDVVI